jgi:N6-L-threonylcarbamoyladenine synthase
MEAHLLAPLLEQESAKMPFIALLVSGGHTLLVLVKSKGEYELVGQTLDDAAGEAFDKAAKLLGLNYPGGPEIARLAKLGEPDIFDFPRPLSRDKESLDFSFSGLKTSLMYRVKQLKEDDALDDQCRADLSYAYQEAIVDSLVGKTELAVEKYEINSVIVAGGVGANKKLRTKMVDVFSKKGVEVIYPSLEFCTDNAAMIALTGLYRFQQGIVNKNYQITVNPRWSIDKIYEGKNAYG